MQRLQSYLDSHGIANWPHIKTHKIPAIAQMQIAAGAAGITCQKIGEVEIMAQAGLRNIFLPYNIIGEAKLNRLMELAQQIEISVTADSAFVVDGLAQAAQQHQVTMPVLVEFDTGLARCGVQTPQQAADLAYRIDRQSNLVFDGLMTYPLNERTDSFVQQTRAILEKDRVSVRRVSVGGTPQMWQAHEHPVVTEYRAGMYIYGDRYTLKSGAMKLEEVAFSVITTVVSRPTPDRGILDGGSKTFSSDLVGLDGYGLILEYPQARIYSFSEEHGHFDFSDCLEKPEIGERLTVIPNHCCSVTNLFNEIVAVRDGVVETIWPVAARGAVQ
ncbi:MAG TPA: alanine racemase [Chloroflexi bacterium]|nr:alanine racemase [Chloroflexota bacterium]